VIVKLKIYINKSVKVYAIRIISETSYPIAFKIFAFRLPLLKNNDNNSISKNKNSNNNIDDTLVVIKPDRITGVVRTVFFMLLFDLIVSVSCAF